MKSLNRAMGKTIRFLHIYQNMVIGALVIVLSIVMLIASNSIKVIASSLTAVDNTAPAGMSKGINSRWICVVFQQNIRHNIALDEVCVIPSHPSKGGVYAVYIHTYVR